MEIEIDDKQAAALLAVAETIKSRKSESRARIPKPDQEEPPVFSIVNDPIMNYWEGHARVLYGNSRRY